MMQVGGKQAATQDCIAFIGNLPSSATEANVMVLCSQIGSVKAVRVVRDKATNLSKGYAFAEFFDPETCLAAITSLNGQLVQGSPARLASASEAMRNPSAYFTGPANSVLGSRQQQQLQQQQLLLQQQLLQQQQQAGGSQASSPQMGQQMGQASPMASMNMAGQAGMQQQAQIGQMGVGGQKQWPQQMMHLQRGMPVAQQQQQPGAAAGMGQGNRGGLMPSLTIGPLGTIITREAAQSLSAGGMAGMAPSALGLPPGYLDQLKQMMKETAGQSDRHCKHGKLCRLVNCTDLHDEGREIEENPTMIICRFGRQCKRSGCFYVHPTGRVIDEDPARGMCSSGIDCKNPECFFTHPEGRPISPLSQVKCYACNGVGHVKGHCPHYGPKYSSQVRVSGFPRDWCQLTVADLPGKILEELQHLGTLDDLPELDLPAGSNVPLSVGLSYEALDNLSATATFVDIPTARTVITALESEKEKKKKLFRKVEMLPPAATQAVLKEKEKCVFVGNLPTECEENDIKEFFKPLAIPEAIRHQRERGFAFVDFPTAELAKRAIEEMNEKRVLGGRRVRVTVQGKENEETIQNQVELKVSTVMITSLPEEYSSIEKEDLPTHLLPSLETLGFLAEMPRVVRGGDAVMARYFDEEIASNTREALIEAGFKADLLLDTATRKKKGNERKKCTVFVGNLPEEATNKEVEALFVVAGPIVDVDIPKQRGYCFVEFASSSSVYKVLHTELIQEPELHGTKLNVQAKDEEPENRTAKRKGKERKQSNIITQIVHIDELALAQRPNVENIPEQYREVWVDSLAGESTEEFLKAFGEIAEIYRVPDPETNKASDRGYVLFEDHIAAATCVESGAGVWSESERMLSSRQGRRDSSSSSQATARAYPGSVIGMILGRNGENFKKLTDKIGATSLALRGEGMGGNATPESNRLHFVCKGSTEALALLRPCLEELIAEVHEAISKRMASDPDFKDEKEDEKFSGPFVAESVTIAATPLSGGGSAARVGRSASRDRGRDRDRDRDRDRGGRGNNNNNNNGRKRSRHQHDKRRIGGDRSIPEAFVPPTSPPPGFAPPPPGNFQPPMGGPPPGAPPPFGWGFFPPPPGGPPMGMPGMPSPTMMGGAVPTMAGAPTGPPGFQSLPRPRPSKAAHLVHASLSSSSGAVPTKKRSLDGPPPGDLASGSAYPRESDYDTDASKRRRKVFTPSSADAPPS